MYMHMHICMCKCICILVLPELRFGVLRSAFCVLRFRTQQMDLRFKLRSGFAFRLRFGCFLNTSHAVLAFWNCVLSDMASKYWFWSFGHFALRFGFAFWSCVLGSARDSLSLLLRFGVAFRFLSKSMLFLIPFRFQWPWWDCMCSATNAGVGGWGHITLRIVRVCSLYAPTTFHFCVVYTIHIWYLIYTYIRRPPLGGHQAARGIGQTACPKSFQSFQSQVDSQVFHHFQSFPVLQSAISSLPVWYQLLAVCKSAIWGLQICLL